MARVIAIPAGHDLREIGRRVYNEVHLERIRAHAKHDPNGGSMERKSFDDPSWLPVLVEEVGEVARALCDYRHLNFDRKELAKTLRSELIQTAAMATAWIEAIDLDIVGSLNAAIEDAIKSEKEKR